jgi:hypothetical protein
VKKSIYTWFTGAALIILLIALLILNGRVSMVSSVEITQSFPLAYDATGAMLDAVVFPMYGDEQIQSPLAQYDDSGAMLDAAVFTHQVRSALHWLAYDATGAMLGAVVFPTYSDQQVSIPTSLGLVYDATGVMLDAVVLTNQVALFPIRCGMTPQKPCWKQLFFRSILNKLIPPHYHPGIAGSPSDQPAL